MIAPKKISLIRQKGKDNKNDAETKNIKTLQKKPLEKNRKKTGPPHHGQIQPVLKNDVRNRKYAGFQAQGQKKPKDTKRNKPIRFESLHGEY